MSDRPELRQAPGSLDGGIGWVPPPSTPTQHDDPAMQAPDVQHDLGPDTPGVLGGAPSTGWSTEDE